MFLIRIRRGLAALAWLALVVAIAFGAAGLVAASDQAPGSGARPELTFSGDREVAVLLESASAQLVALADQVASLGVQARGALAALNGANGATVTAAIAEGDRLIDDLTERAVAIRVELAAMPYVGTPGSALHLSRATVARHSALLAALDATDGLQDAWVRLTTGSIAAIQLSTLLARHDEQVLAAAGLGRAARYEDAMAGLDQADATIAESRHLRDRLANTVDVSILDSWLDRNAAYDGALRDLYGAIATVGGRVTPEVRGAITAERAAKAQLPPDTRALVVIMAEIGRGGMNGAVIAIEEARGRLTSAIAAAASPRATP